MASNEYILPAESVPNLDDWGIDDYWSLADWCAWHRGLAKKFGRVKDKDGFEIADRVWLTWWAKQTAYASPILALMQPSRYKAETDYLKQFPLIYQLSGLQMLSEQINPIDLPYQVASNTTQAIVNASESVSTTAKVIKYGVPAAFIFFLILLFAYSISIYRKKTTSTT